MLTIGVSTMVGTPIFQWCMVWYGSKNVYQEDMWSEEIGLNDVIMVVGCSKYDNENEPNSQQ